MKSYTFTLANGSKVKFTQTQKQTYHHNEFDAFTITDKAGNTYITKAPYGVLDANGNIVFDLAVKVFKNGTNEQPSSLSIGFDNADNREVYQQLIDDLKQPKPEIEGYEELEKLHAEHDVYAQHVANCIDQDLPVTMIQPADLEPIMQTYPTAALLLKARLYQNSENINKYSAGIEAEKLINDECADKAKDILNNWHK